MMENIIKMTKRVLDKPYNAGTMTSSAFWGFIRSTLRQKSRWWKPISECKRLSRRRYSGPNKRQKWEYQCNECKNWFNDKQVAVDHIVPCGTLKSAEDLPGFVTKLFCEIDGLQVLCDTCHNQKTLEDKLKLKNENSDGNNDEKKTFLF